MSSGTTGAPGIARGWAEIDAEVASYVRHSANPRR